MMRKGKEGDFRSNLHRGGYCSLVKISPDERATAVRSAKVMGLNVAGVDLLRSNAGPWRWRSIPVPASKASKRQPARTSPA